MVLSEEQATRIEKSRRAALARLSRNQQVRCKLRDTGQNVPVKLDAHTSSIGLARDELVRDVVTTKGVENKRVLPQPIQSGAQQKKKERALPSSIAGARGGSTKSLPSLRFTGDLVYVWSVSEADAAIDRLLNQSSGQDPKVQCLGFDIEWVVTFKAGVPPRPVATIQLSSNEICVVFQTSNFGTGAVPLKLAEVLADPAVLKVGVGASRDAIKVETDLGVRMAGVVNCEDVAWAKALPPPPPHSCGGGGGGGMSLQALCARVLARWVSKPAHLRLGSWEATPLPWDQLCYAAVDAYAGLRLHQALVRLPDARPQGPPPPAQLAPSAMDAGAVAGAAAGEGAAAVEHQAGSHGTSSPPLPPMSDCSVVPARGVPAKLAPAKRACWERWHTEGDDPVQIAEARRIKLGTVLSYLSDAIEAGYAYRWARLGVPSRTEGQVRDAVGHLCGRSGGGSGPNAPLSNAAVGAAPSSSPERDDHIDPLEQGAAASTAPLALAAPESNTTWSLSRRVREHLGPNAAVPYWVVRAVLLHLDRINPRPVAA